ncbi:heme exporter protein D [Polynucleobacter meluiroseus]|uniref:Heme exporter protein D n=1 Tax=Polynucleobacter meluiroseus TaxID=1938814 RepID=A0A240DYL6_9BURK|nr:heme exporter protein CcmD [Polynucleobacter meluiroseus]SNX28113.1 heme exporter protein D [Polynucleobacter meluiroseus]
MWNTTSEFLAMGGYALYVWSSFGMTALVLILEPLFLRARIKATLRRLKREVLADRLEHGESD